MSVTPIVTHAADALARMLQEYKNSPLLKSLISAFTDEIQTLEDNFQTIDLTRAIGEASGVTLENIANVVGVSRGVDTPDDIFRILIFGKIAANISQGETESVIATYALLTQSTEVRLDEFFPASVGIYSNGEVDPLVAPFIAIYLKQAVAAGVSIEGFGTFPASGSFGFATDPGALGFGDEFDPTVGGGLASQLG